MIEDAEALDRSVRLAAFDFLEDLALEYGDEISRKALAQGFDFRGERVALVGPQGIFKPAILPEMPLSITTAPPVERKDPPYRDVMGADGLLRYHYRGTDPAHHENVGLRRAMERRVPLVYFFGIVRGLYMPVWPVFIVGEEPRRLSFVVAVDDARIPVDASEEAPLGVAEARRAYVTTLTVRRLHQRSFRARVLRAYRECCAVCRLRHRELLEASHILPDAHPKGEPIVPNGIALCKLHHAAFDRNILGVRPDLGIEIRRDVLDEVDGPMLIHGLQGFDGGRLEVPKPVRLRPDPEFLAERYEVFRRAG